MALLSLYLMPYFIFIGSYIHTTKMFALGTHCHLYSTGNGVRVGYPTRIKSTPKKRNVHGQRKKFASPNARDTNMLVFFALGNAKVLSFAQKYQTQMFLRRSGI